MLAENLTDSLDTFVHIVAVADRYFEKQDVGPLLRDSIEHVINLLFLQRDLRFVALTRHTNPRQRLDFIYYDHDLAGVLLLRAAFDALEPLWNFSEGLQSRNVAHHDEAVHVAEQLTHRRREMGTLRVYLVRKKDQRLQTHLQS